MLPDAPLSTATSTTIPHRIPKKHMFSPSLAAFPQADVINRGFGGYNTRWALHMVDELIASHRPQGVKLVTVFFGANDAAHSDRGA